MNRNIKLQVALGCASLVWALVPLAKAEDLIIGLPKAGEHPLNPLAA